MDRLSIVDKGVIYRNPYPGHRVINVIYPNIAVLPKSELLCAARVGQALYSPDAVIELFRSTDAGNSWQREGPPWDRARDDGHRVYGYPQINRMPDETLVLNITRAVQPDPDLYIKNPNSDGGMPQELMLLHSTDHGHRWTDMTISKITDPFEPRHLPNANGSIEVLADGSWFHSFETWKYFGDPRPYDLNTYGMFSHDRGRSWHERVPIAVGSDQNRSYSHGGVARMDDGRMFISLWTQSADLQESFDLHMVHSTDTTLRHWSTPKSIGIHGQSSGAACMGDGRMLLIYSHREKTDQPGIKLALSEDGGQTFDHREPLVVWDAYGKEELGVARSDTYPSSHDAIAYGAPRVVRLDQQHAMAHFWCTQGADTHIRWVKVAVEV